MPMVYGLNSARDGEVEAERATAVQRWIVHA
jgi:hypothetical protein